MNVLKMQLLLKEPERYEDLPLDELVQLALEVSKFSIECINKHIEFFDDAVLLRERLTTLKLQRLDDLIGQAEQLKTQLEEDLKIDEPTPNNVVAFKPRQ